MTTRAEGQLTSSGSEPRDLSWIRQQQLAGFLLFMH